MVIIRLIKQNYKIQCDAQEARRQAIMSSVHSEDSVHLPLQAAILLAAAVNGRNEPSIPWASRDAVRKGQGLWRVLR